MWRERSAPSDGARPLDRTVRGSSETCRPMGGGHVGRMTWFAANETDLAAAQAKAVRSGLNVRARPGRSEIESVFHGTGWAVRPLRGKGAARHGPRRGGAIGHVPLQPSDLRDAISGDVTANLSIKYKSEMFQGESDIFLPRAGSAIINHEQYSTMYFL